MSDALTRIQALRADDDLFFEAAVRIRAKDGKTIPFKPNAAQHMVSAAYDEQMIEKGYVRLLILKARQQGISTWVQAKNYKKTTLYRGVSTYILTHEQAASEIQFGMVDRMQRMSPLAPHVGTSNAKELVFDKIDSRYIVATAGTKAGGRGGAITHFHGSEVAFWPNATDHFAASVQQVPLLPGTSVILESTANGPSGEFYDRWQMAVAGRGDFKAVFIPWFVTPEYVRPVDGSFELNVEPEDGELSEVEYAEMFELTDEQMCWRRYKILEMSAHKFRQEYPATADEAFVSSDKNSLIDSLTVLRARKRKVHSGGPLIIGVDPAGAGGDRFAVAYRRGYRVEKVIYRDKIDAPEAIAWLRSIIDDDKPEKMFIDQGGLGAPIISMLKSAGPQYLKIIEGVNFGSTSQSKLAKPKNAGPKRRRDEMWSRMRDWLKQEEGVQIPDDDALHSDLIGVWIKNDLNNDLVLATKEEMKAKGIRSPDLGDAVALTFASSVWVGTPAIVGQPDPYQKHGMDRGGVKSYGYQMPPPRVRGHGSGWMT